jgi:hypothetical protein
MGADLYNNLIRYFVTHLKSLREVSTPICHYIRLTRATRKPTRSKMKPSCNTMPANGRDILLAPTTSIGYSLISIGTGSNGKGTRAGKGFTRSTRFAFIRVYFRIHSDKYSSLHSFSGKTTCLSPSNGNTRNWPARFSVSSNSNETAKLLIRAL